MSTFTKSHCRLHRALRNSGRILIHCLKSKQLERLESIELHESFMSFILQAPNPSSHSFKDRLSFFWRHLVNHGNSEVHCLHLSMELHWNRSLILRGGTICCNAHGLARHAAGWRLEREP